MNALFIQLYWTQLLFGDFHSSHWATKKTLHTFPSNLLPKELKIIKLMNNIMLVVLF
jgi:hypothetical protein